MFAIFLIFAQNIDCGYMLEPPCRGGSNEYLQSMFWSKNKKKKVYPCKPQFFYIKVFFFFFFFFFFSFQFRKIITCYRRIGYNLNVMRQSACLVFNPIMVDNYAAFFNCTPVGRASDSMMAPT